MLLLLTIISAFLYASFIEYSLHRFIQHSSYEMDHIKNHHRIFHGIKSYEDEAAKSEDILLDAKGLLINGSIYLLPASLIFMSNRMLGFTFALVCFLYNFWEECVHLYSHRSSNTFLERVNIFKRLKEHHRVHHYIYNSNYGIGSTIWDIIFRTKRTADREREARMAKND
jgi:hypothetical protein